MADDKPERGLPCALTADRDAPSGGLVAREETGLLDTERVDVGLARLGRLPGIGAALSLEGAAEALGGAASDVCYVLGAVGCGSMSAGGGASLSPEASSSLPSIAGGVGCSGTMAIGDSLAGAAGFGLVAGGFSAGDAGGLLCSEVIAGGVDELGAGAGAPSLADASDSGSPPQLALLAMSNAKAAAQIGAADTRWVLKCRTSASCSQTSLADFALHLSSLSRNRLWMAQPQPAPNSN